MQSLLSTATALSLRSNRTIAPQLPYGLSTAILRSLYSYHMGDLGLPGSNFHNRKILEICLEMSKTTLMPKLKELDT